MQCVNLRTVCLVNELSYAAVENVATQVLMNDDEINGAKQGGYKKSCDMICSSRSFIRQQQTNEKIETRLGIGL